ncbi:hypothetical protein [Sulfurimonas sp.]|uniref:hypothetical protein n=1 Tax=Sulfurimonas sp. TaxID=2022749 RepID=UPI003565B964
MLNDEDYDVLKKSFIDSQRLFNKLNDVANQASELDYDESGLFYEEEEILDRHWLKLSSKIIDALGESLDTYNIELLKNDSLEDRELTINLVKEDESSKVVVDYSEDGALSISQVS